MCSGKHRFLGLRFDTSTLTNYYIYDFSFFNIYIYIIGVMKHDFVVLNQLSVE